MTVPSGIDFEPDRERQEQAAGDRDDQDDDADRAPCPRGMSDAQTRHVRRFEWLLEEAIWQEVLWIVHEVGGRHRARG